MPDPTTIIHPSETQVALDAGGALAAPQRIADGLYTHAIPLHVIDLEKWAPSPRRATGVYRPATVEAFTDIVTRHEDPDHTTIWVHPTNGRIVAVFNDNGTDPGWRDHRAELTLTRTDEWNHWLSRDGSLGSQREFAEHLEDGLGELSAPPAADMLELAQTFQAKQDVSFRSAIRLQDGTMQAQYDEQLDAAAGQSGQMTIPTVFELAIAPFLGEDPYKLTARLRYRLSSNRLSIGYKLERPNDVIRDALDSVRAKLAAAFATVVIGDPA